MKDLSNQPLPPWIRLRIWALQNLPVFPQVRRSYHVDHLNRCMRLPARELAPDSYL